MKSLKLFSLLVVTGCMTMSMGFPVDFSNGKNKKDTTPIAAAKANHIDADKNKSIEVVLEEEPVQQVSMPEFSSTSTITVKVFNVKGNLVMKEEVSMGEFLSKKAALPNGSTFVMFHQNTAYYFMETGLTN